MRYPDYWVVKIRRFLNANKTGAPFLSGDSLASLADYHAYGPLGTSDIDVGALSRAESLFVNSDRLEKLLDEYGGSIRAQVLITGNGDKNWEHLIPLPASIVMWFAQNSSIRDHQVKTLPIGIENLRHGSRGLPQFYKPLPGPRIEDKVLVPPMADTNAIRSITVDEALDLPEIFSVETTYLRLLRYFKLVRRHRFVLCLEGNGSDTHRVWETLYFGNFPVLLSTPWSRSLRYLGLPLLVVNSLSDVSQRLLADFCKRHENFAPESAPQLWLPFWSSMVKGYTEKRSPWPSGA